MSDVIVGKDVGYGQTKSWCSDGRSVRYPSLAARVGNDVMASQVKPNFIDRTRQKWLVGEQARFAGAEYPMVDSSYITDPEYMVLACHALTRLGLKKAKVVMGLPILRFEQQKDILLRQIKTWPEITGIEFDVLKVLPQPMGAVLDICYDENGQPKPELEELMSKRIVIIDCGQGTTDQVEVYHGVPHTQNHDSVQVGISDVFDRVRLFLETRKQYTPSAD